MTEESQCIYLSGYGCEDAIDWSFVIDRGWFADARWMELEPKDGRTLRFELLEKAPAVGVFAPRDGRDNWLYVMPELGLSGLLLIFR